MLLLILFAGDEILPGHQTISFNFPEQDSGTRWPVEFSLILEDVHKMEWYKNKISKLETSFFNTIYNKYKITEIPIHKKDYWILDNGICLQRYLSCGLNPELFKGWFKNQHKKFR